MSVDANDQVVSFDEKPDQPAGIPGDPGHALASMGVCGFSLPLLSSLLRDDHDAASAHDFGSDIIPAMVGRNRVVAYRFGGSRGRVTADHYWRDVGTLIIGGSAKHSILFPDVRLGEGAMLRRCIVDKHVAIPAGERIGFDPGRDVERFTVSDRGVVVIGKGYQFGAS